MPDLHEVRVPTEADELLAGLTPEQREAVTCDAEPLLVVAGPGSGKTRVLTARIAWQARTGRLDPRRVLAVTFTRKAAEELVGRLGRLGLRHQVTAGTFHALALAQLRRRRLDQGRGVPQLLDRKTRLLAPLLGDSGASAPEVAREIEWAKARVVTPDRYVDAARAAARPAPLPRERLAEVYDRYERDKRRRGLVDFEDLLLGCAEAIEQDAEFATAVRWLHRHVFVDEFQDLNPAQFRLLVAWLGGREQLCAVGDAEQAIYGFGGADARYVAEFHRHFGEHARVLHLTANFRSTAQITAVAHAVLSPTPALHAGQRSAHQEGPTPVLTAYDDDRAELEGVARAVLRLRHDGTPWSSMAVLARTNEQCAALAETLRTRGVPARVRHAGRFLRRPAVARALEAMRDAQRAAPRLPLAAHLADLEDTRRGLPATEPDAAELAVLVDLAREYLAAEGGGGSVDGLAAYVAASVRADDPVTHAPDGAVDVLTFHRAKGLEWPVVLVTGLEDGLVPSARAVTDAARAEERRLLHVALSRAERVLLLSWARRRGFGGRMVERALSPFLAPVADLLARGDEPAGGVGPTDEARRLIDAARAALAASGPERDPESSALLEALVEWRRRRALAAGVPAGAILDDVALGEIATLRPGDVDALRAIRGIGPARLARYGPEIVDLVAGYPG